MHCPTCTCEPKYGYSLTVYPANETLYGCCETCGRVFWSTELSHWSHGKGWDAIRALHCGCCTHPHDLAPGGHDFTLRQWKARKARTAAEDGQ